MKYHHYILMLMAMLLLPSCSKKRNGSNMQPSNLVDVNALGKYVYMDDNNVCHRNSKCLYLTSIDDNGHELYAKHPIDTAELVIYDKTRFRVCANCVNDSIYERLLEISKRNISNNGGYTPTSESRMRRIRHVDFNTNY